MKISPVWRHVLPFALWIGIMSLPLPDAGWRYLLQTAVCLLALMILRPWQGYGPLRLGHLPLALGCGVGVFGIWILPESGLLKSWPGIQEFYVNTLVRGPLNPDATYSPAVSGWAMALIRLGGSAFVIAVIEEFFWRGFLMRWMSKGDFMGVPPAAVGWGILGLVSLAFGLEHNRWLVGCVAGLAYGLLYRRQGDIWAASLAHVTTNFLLGLYVLVTGAYQFWN